MINFRIHNRKLGENIINSCGKWRIRFKSKFSTISNMGCGLERKITWHAHSTCVTFFMEFM
jgi:hypothetical protein